MIDRYVIMDEMPNVEYKWAGICGWENDIKNAFVYKNFSDADMMIESNFAPFAKLKIVQIHYKIKTVTIDISKTNPNVSFNYLKVKKFPSIEYMYEFMKNCGIDSFDFEIGYDL